jgi:hypothetical protein
VKPVISDAREGLNKALSAAPLLGTTAAVGVSPCQAI